MSPIRYVGERLFHRRLQETGPSLTFARLCTSRHLEDLQNVAFFAIAVFVGVFIWAASGVPEVNNTVISVLLAGTVALLNWAYQSGSRRIGVIDLFACEISAICRVLLVVDFAQSSVALAEREITAQAAAKAVAPDVTSIADVATKRFTSEENYTPVYDTNLAALEPLDVNVVTSVTEFYTYRKTMMDYLRVLAETRDLGERIALRSGMLYMQFLMYESGRMAIDNLVEFEPNRAESIINILCSELVLFGFLRQRYADDYRGDRLRLRDKSYDLVPKLNSDVIAGPYASWERAQVTAPEMMLRYNKMRADLEATPVPPIPPPPA